MENISNIGLSSKGNSARHTITSTDEGVVVGVYSMPSMLVTSWRLRNNGTNAVNYKILTSMEDQPDPDDGDDWDEHVGETEIAAGAVADGQDNEAHYTAIIAVVTSAVAENHSDVRVIVAGSV